MITDRIARLIDSSDLIHIGEYTVGGVPIDLSSATLTFDEAYLPYALLRVRAKAPTSQADLDRMDPRAVTRVKVRMGYQYDDGKIEVEDMADLVLDERVIERPANTLSLVAQGNERLVIDRGVGTSDVVLGPESELFDSIVKLIRRAIPGAPTQDDGTRVRGWIPEGETIVVKPGENPLSTVVDAADRNGDLWVYADGLGVWRVTRRPAIASSPFLTLEVGVNGTMIKTTSKLGRSEWANMVQLVHTWTDPDGNDQRVEAVAQIMTGEYRPDVVGRKIKRVERDTAIAPAEARTSAAALLRRATSRGRTLTLEAIADYRLRPGHTVGVILPLGGLELHLVTAVHFEQPVGIMTVETRIPDNADISTGE